MFSAAHPKLYSAASGSGVGTVGFVALDAHGVGYQIAKANSYHSKSFFHRDL